MVKVEFAKNAKTIQVIGAVFDREQAQEIAEKHKTSAFGTLTNIMKAFNKNRGQLILTGYRLRYDPFWYIVGESFYEYHRKSTYEINVKPEVQSVYLNKDWVKVQPEAPVCVLEGIDHCFEHYTKEIVQDALKPKGKDYQKYLDAKSKPIKNVEELQRKDVDVIPVGIRASFLLTNLTKDVLKPIQADEILDERVVIDRLTLFMTPVHIFEFKEENRDSRGTIEVDGVTGAWQKGTKLITELTKKYWNADTMFDITTEAAGNILPGTGVAMIIAKKIYDKRKEGKIERHRQELRSLYQTRRKK
ncbi:MAG TPA: hypothetical protein VLJ21_00970 [Candidatus Binatia bacterium]|nr:hypothetical protein [Candidatus Binatia bacterium]